MKPKNHELTDADLEKVVGGKRVFETDEVPAPLPEEPPEPGPVPTVGGVTPLPDPRFGMMKPGHRKHK